MSSRRVALGLARFGVPVAILLAGAGGALALYKSRPVPPPIESREKAWIVEVESVAPQTAIPTLALYGRVSSPRAARLRAAITADVRSVTVLEGQRAKAGALLVHLDDREARLTFAQRTAESEDIAAQIATERARHEADRSALASERKLVELATKEVERLRKLAESNVGSRSQLDQARQTAERYTLDVKDRELSLREHASRMARLEAQLARAEALRDLAALDLERTEIRAPFDGRVAKVLVSPGDRVRAGDGLVSFYDTGNIEIRSQVPTRYLPVVRSALDAGTRLEAKAVVDGIEIRAQLERLTGEVERRSGGADALLRVTQGGAGLQLGRTVALTLALPALAEVLALPFESLYGSDRIFVLDELGERMRAVPVSRVGEMQRPDATTRVLLRAPEIDGPVRVVVTQLPNAIDGLRVRIVDEPG